MGNASRAITGTLRMSRQSTASLSSVGTCDRLEGPCWSTVAPKPQTANATGSRASESAQENNPNSATVSWRVTNMNMTNEATLLTASITASRTTVRPSFVPVSSSDTASLMRSA